MVIGLELVDDIVHHLNPKAVLAQDSLHFFNEIIVQDGTFNLLAVGKQGKSGNDDECNFHVRMLLVCIFHRIRLEGNFGAECCRDQVEIADGVAGADLILFDFEKGGGAALVEHVADDSS